MDLHFIFIVMWQKCLFEIEEVDILCSNIGERCVCFRFTYIKMYMECKHTGIITEMQFHLVMCAGLRSNHVWTGMCLVVTILLFGFFYPVSFASSYQEPQIKTFTFHSKTTDDVNGIDNQTSVAVCCVIAGLRQGESMGHILPLQATPSYGIISRYMTCNETVQHMITSKP